MALVRAFWAFKRIFTPKKASAGCEHCSATRDGRSAAGASRAASAAPGADAGPGGQGDGERGPLSLVPPPALLPLGSARGLACSNGARTLISLQRLHGAAYLNGLERHRAPFPNTAPSPAAGLSRQAGRAAATFRPRSPQTGPSLDSLPLASRRRRDRSPFPSQQRGGALPAGESTPSPAVLPPGFPGSRPPPLPTPS